jgi:hypothetical protein
MSDRDPLDGLGDVELGPAAQQCTRLERRLAFALATGLAESAAAAARMAGYSSKGGGDRVSAHRALSRSHVREAAKEFAGTELLSQVGLALKANRELLLNPKHPSHEKAVSSTLNRLGFGERTGVDVNVSGGIVMKDHDRLAVEDLRMCIALKYTEEMLIEAFGYSGLPRYRKMMEEEDRKRGHLIEGDASEINDTPGHIDEPRHSPFGASSTTRAR